jgi:hypothetical protein
MYEAGALREACAEGRQTTEEVMGGMDTRRPGGRLYMAQPGIIAGNEVQCPTSRRFGERDGIR